MVDPIAGFVLDPVVVFLEDYVRASFPIFAGISSGQSLLSPLNGNRWNGKSMRTGATDFGVRFDLLQLGGIMKKYIAELVGTFILVLFGCGTAVIAGDKVGILGIAFAFGLALIGAAYGIGPISGCHINPAVSLGVWIAGRMKTVEMIGYWAGQFVGAILGAWVLSVIARGAVGYSIGVNGLGQNGWGPGYQGGYDVVTAMVFEFVATLIFVIVILGSTQKSAPAGFAGLAIGITLVAIHIFGIHITGVSVNPARSIGPALLAGGTALSQLWLFLVFPSLGGLVAGLLFRTKVLEAE